MLFDRPIAPETYALIRFGLGYPARGAPTDAGTILARLAGPDRVVERYPLLPFSETERLTIATRDARNAREMSGGKEALQKARNALNVAYLRTLQDEFRRGTETDDPFRERLMAFWANHFTARTNGYVYRSGHAGYAADAIRPHLTGRFADMLKAVAVHPFMLYYLDQRLSIGPNSPVGLAKNRGLNENFAREVLELHTVGVDGAYTQRDVRQLAELFTGLTSSIRQGFRFRPRWSEPGAERVLGEVYGGRGDAKIEDIFAVLEDLAVHPSTADFLAKKLAVHFVADLPDADLIAHMAAAYRRSGGALMALYAAMLEHPAAWRGFGAKAKSPLEYMVSAARALGLRASDFEGERRRRIRKLILLPLNRMGQPYAEPPGPDGWPDDISAWINPHGLAARIGWALTVKDRFKLDAIDPRRFVEDALADAAGSRLAFAASGAETRAEGIALILGSAEFNRR